jgi:hypothetical protein
VRGLLTITQRGALQELGVQHKGFTQRTVREMADLAREGAPEPETASGKRGVDQTVEPQAEPQKRVRTSESATEPAPQREEAERPSDSPAGDEAEEDAAPVSRGLALAEKEIQQKADEKRAAGDTQLADAIEATLVTTAPQREAALAPKQNHIDQLAEDLLAGDDEETWKWTETNLTKEETAEYDQRLQTYNEDHLELVLAHLARKRPNGEILAGIYE